MDRFVEYASTYWYIAASLALILFLGVVVLIFFISKATKKIKEDAEVNKGRKEEIERKRQADEAERKSREEVVKNSARQEEAKEEDLTEAVVEGEEEVEDEPKEEAVEEENPAKRTVKAVYRVIYDKENKEWMVKKDGAQRVIRRVKTKAEALELANQFATNQELSLSVQKKDGKFQKKRNYKTMIPQDKGDKKE
jgi:uncharacterized membrane protein